MRIAIIDGDIVAYKAAVKNQVEVDWDDDGDVSIAADFDAALVEAARDIQDLALAVEAQEIVLAFSCRDSNFRKRVYPPYKTNRKGTGPIHRRDVEDCLMKDYNFTLLPDTEGDDSMGVLATTNDDNDYIMVSIDKDMLTVPGKVYNPLQPDNGIVVVTEVEAARKHAIQTICGDTVDGYPGCFRLGPKSSFALRLEETEEINDMWPIVVEAYESKGFTEEDALVQARCAYILQDGDYDFETNKVRLWEPPK